MPPLPSTFDEETQKLIDSARRHERDIAEFQIPRLRDCKGPLSSQQNLATELREDIDAFARQVEALDVLVDDQRGEKNRRELRRVTEELRDSLLQLRKDSRAALLTSKRAIDSMSVSNRAELFKSAAMNEKQTLNEKVTEDTLMKVNNDVTDALRRTVGLLQGELERSVLSSQLLEQSTASLRATSSTHDMLANAMGTSKELITALEKTDWMDRMLIIAALVFFILVVLFILKQRIVDRSLRIAFWWTRFLPDFSEDAELLKNAQEAVALTASAISTVSSLASVVTSTFSSISSEVSVHVEASSSSTNSADPIEASISEILSSVVAESESSVSESVTELELPEITVETGIKTSESLEPVEHEEL
ncbi:Sec20-domain-containing protein [Dendrothele bispora CBS 962.96]|uniref:Sec20-domain-containing protein n=1 Tax=Dendrothele bispora (strain CBS 962.96) TaxID=1314807 RepID=A0A4S8MHC2_DENBC|nr:Sec20-domain-containing protein [Dendrothele bispora CBS 962.96]